MERIEYHHPAEAKEMLPPGPWMAEPDKVQWQDEATGLPCLIHRSMLGFLCGYAGVNPGHPLHGAHYNDDAALTLRVHAGLSYSEGCQHTGDPAWGVCHVPDEGEPDDVWWFGFACDALLRGDVIPSMADNERLFRLVRVSFEPTYRDLAYVTAEVTVLAAMLKAMK